MCAPAIVPILGAVIGAGASMYSAKQQEKAQAKQAKQQQQDRDRQSRQQAAMRTDMEGQTINLDEQTGIPGGIGSTFLTGAGGISNDKLNLSGTKNILGG